MKYLWKPALAFVALVFVISSFVIPNINSGSNQVLERKYVTEKTNWHAFDEKKDSIVLEDSTNVDRVQDNYTLIPASEVNLKLSVLDSVVTEEMTISPLIYSRSIQFEPKTVALKPIKSMVSKKKIKG